MEVRTKATLVCLLSTELSLDRGQRAFTPDVTAEGILNDEPSAAGELLHAQTLQPIQAVKLSRTCLGTFGLVSRV